MIQYADIIKVDVLNTSKEDLGYPLNILKRYPVKLLAEKIEDHEMFQYCKELGFEYFQGFFLSKPENISGKTLQSSQTTIFNILIALHNPDITLKEVETLVSRDPALSFKVLRIINSPAVRVQKEVTSIRKAINLLGLKQIKRWATLISFTKLSNKPDILFLEALFRAKMCEAIATRISLKEPDMFFTVGLFSMLDAFFDQPISDILEPLPLAEKVKSAIKDKNGLAGNILKLVLLHQQGRWKNIP